MKSTAWAAALLLAGSLTACSSSGTPAVVTVTATPTSAAVSPSTAPSTTATGGTASASATSAPASSAAATGGTASAAAAPSAKTAAAADAKGAAAVQKALAAKGYKIPATGVMGDATTSAIKSFQRDNGLAATGEADDAFWSAIKGAEAAASAGAAAQAGAGAVAAAVAGAPAQGQAGAVATAQPGANECTALFAQWDAAVASGARGSRATAQSAHDMAMAQGCNPNKWLPSSMTKVYDPGTHHQGQSCSMSEIAHYDGAGLVCTQDVEGSPHWN